MGSREALKAVLCTLLVLNPLFWPIMLFLLALYGEVEEDGDP